MSRDFALIRPDEHGVISIADQCDTLLDVQDIKVSWDHIVVKSRGVVALDQ